MKFLALVSLSLVSLAAGSALKYKSCKCFPGDTCWPSEKEWDAFNATVGGSLIKTVPLGSPCHEPHYDQARCEELTSEWMRPPLQ
jgi:hypothetical protein